jgi:hypothetical protein
VLPSCKPPSHEPQKSFDTSALISFQISNEGMSHPNISIHFISQLSWGGGHKFHFISNHFGREMKINGAVREIVSLHFFEPPETILTEREGKGLLYRDQKTGAIRTNHTEDLLSLCYCSRSRNCQYTTFTYSNSDVC